MTGPSAGLAFVVAIVSALTGRLVTAGYAKEQARILSTNPAGPRYDVDANWRNTPMRTNTTNHASLSEVTILAHVLGNGRGQLPPVLARYLLGRGFSEGDKARMHDLAVRNQDDGLSSPEKEELLAWAKAGTVLSILKSKARRTLRIKPKKRSRS